MKFTNNHNLPEVLVAALTYYESSAPGLGLRATSLIGAPRPRLLFQKHHPQIIVDVSSKCATGFGSAFHSWLENAIKKLNDPSYILEERCFVEVNGTRISGAIDIQKLRTDGSVNLMDTKTCSVYKVLKNDVADWEKQLNVYAFLVRHAKKQKVHRLSVLAFIKDWKAIKAEAYTGTTTKKNPYYDPDYPPSQILEIPIELWSDDKQDKFVAERVKIHAAATLENLPECTDEERWLAKGSFAVQRGKQKKALKLVNSFYEAEQWIKINGKPSDVIEERPKVYRKCESWCDSAPFCDQHKRG